MRKPLFRVTDVEHGEHLMSERVEAGPSPYEEVEMTLRDEFAGVHSASTVTRCVEAAHHGALEVTGCAHAGLVERIARKHLHVLALVANESE